MNSGRTISFNVSGLIGNAQTVTNPLDLIKQFGFVRAGSCSCGGTQNEIYKKDNLVLYYRKRRHVFKIKKKNETMVPVTSLTNLETELKKLFPDVAVEEKRETAVCSVSGAR
jgi:hypothetical protein